ncbi:MAG TPA: hypothetical protein VHX36_12860 [Candidatus Acidoferrales bacterium]|nr:hypothetical protein [Candidatus Acidoferrales bacterium]
MRIDSTHKKWLIASAIILVVATAIYIPYAAASPYGPSGASAIGLTFGITGSAFMIFAGLLGARKRFPVWRIGRAQAWMRGHLWLGILSLPLILFHGGFRLGGPLTTALMVLLIVVVLSGIFGAALQHYLPAVMTEQVPLETIFEQIDRVRGQLIEEADETVARVAALVAPLVTATPARVAIATEEAPVITDADVAPLRAFYEREMRPFAGKPDARGYALADAAKARAIFAGLRTLLPPATHDAVKELEEICEEERELRRQVRLHHWLHDWLLFHIPVSLALLLLGAVHAVMALRY